MKRWLIALALAGGCKQQAAPPPPPPVAPMTPAEIQRSQDACADYVKRVCACAEQVPAVAGQCKLARALPDAVRLSLAVAGNPATKGSDALRAQASVHETVKQCIEQMAKLPGLGCPP